MREHSHRLNKSGIIAIAVAALLLAGIIVLLSIFRIVGGVLIPRSAGDDLRDVNISAEQYERICEKLGYEPRWSVPIGGRRFDSASESIGISSFGLADVPAFAYMDKLKTVDATGADCFEELLALHQARPELELIYSVGINGEAVDSRVEELKPAVGTSAAELGEKLKYLLKLQTLDLLELGLSDGEEDKLIAQYPSVSFIRGEYFGDVLVTNRSTEFSGVEYSSNVVARLCKASAKLSALQLIDFGDSVLSHEDYAALKASYPGAELMCMLSFYGVVTDANAQTLTLDNIQISDTAELDKAVELMPKLETVYMSWCGLSDEELNALNEKYENVRIVWTVSIKGFHCRTDADNFCVSRITSRYGDMRDHHVSPIRYCTDMVTLDLGHMFYEHIDFVENMPKLRYLILGDTRISSIEPLRNCKDLYYLEMFLTLVSDLSPLLELKELRHLNVSYCRLEDYTQLFELTWLDRLWFVDSGLTLTQQQEIRDALPDTEVCFWTASGSSVDYFWRIDDSYFEMRDNLGMWYHYDKPVPVEQEQTDANIQ